MWESDRVSNVHPVDESIGLAKIFESGLLISLPRGYDEIMSGLFPSLWTSEIPGMPDSSPLQYPSRSVVAASSTDSFFPFISSHVTSSKPEFARSTDPAMKVYNEMQASGKQFGHQPGDLRPSGQTPFGLMLRLFVHKGQAPSFPSQQKHQHNTASSSIIQFS